MGTTDETLSAVRAYHRACHEAAEADQSFGGLVTGVELLSELGEGNEAMLLYDIVVEGLGKIRIAEHFTVAEGQIRRIRQIHDTAALRAAGFAQSG